MELELDGSQMYSWLRLRSRHLNLNLHNFQFSSVFGRNQVIEIHSYTVIPHLRIDAWVR